MVGEPVVERGDVEVLFCAADDGVENIQRLWVKLETAIGSLHGRKFYGVFFPETNRYHACVERTDSDDPTLLGLEKGSLPGGRYARVRLHGEPPGVYERIGPTFDELAKRPDHDPSRPGIEFYRRRDEIDLLLPVR